jgi:hypothetical protein
MSNPGLALWARVQACGTSLIRFSPNSALSLAALLFAVLLLPSSAWATTSKNCPPEPAQATIVSGLTYFGTNCVLNTASDLDTFTFNAAAGDTWTMVTGATNATYPNNICLTLNDPKGTSVNSACSNSAASIFSAGITTKLTVAGAYTIVVFESKDAAIDYGVSLERLSPAPPDGTALTLGKTISGEVNPPSAQDAYTFYGDTTGTYEVSATMTSGAYPQNLCFSVYQPGGTLVVSPACTNTAAGTFTVQRKFTPTVNGTHVAVVFTEGENYTLNYTLNVACVAGVCNTPPPTCALADALSYNATSGTLTMNFTLGTPVAVTWNAWLTSQNTMQSLWSVSQPVTEPPIPITKAQALAKSGKVGILSTLTTATGGITCSNWTVVNTGTP